MKQELYIRIYNDSSTIHSKLVFDKDIKFDFYVLNDLIIEMAKTYLNKCKEESK